jgi:DNA-binding CsgD family transcriptional regulator
MQEIARLLNINQKTLEFHRHQIMEEFNLKSSADFGLVCLKRGLVSVNIEP